MTFRRPLIYAAAVILLAFISGLAAATEYFPQGQERWYAKHLLAMGEPSLYENRLNASEQEVRFLLLRTFHKPVAIRIWKIAGEAKLRVVRLSGAGGYEPGQVEFDQTRSISAAQWDQLMGLMQKASIWEMNGENNESGNDGAQWILEALMGSRYQMVDRWTPMYEESKRHLGAYVACCRYLLALSGLSVPDKEIY